MGRVKGWCGGLVFSLLCWTLFLPLSPFITFRQRDGVPMTSFSLVLSPAKDLVTRLMEVEQDQRITAEEAISHEW